MEREARSGILILGGGFAGAYVARLLGSRGATIVSHENFMLYTPLLPEAASGTLEPRHTVVPLRVMCPQAELLLGDLTSVDLEGRTATIETDVGPQLVRWRELVLALGAVPRTVPVPGLREHALSFKSLPDAINLRNHVLRRLEAADSALDEESRRAQLSFVFVGAGYAGVEALAELSDLAGDAMRYYPRLRDVPRRWVLVDAAPKILPEIPPRLGEYAARELAERGVEIHVGTTLESVTRTRPARRRHAHPDAHARLDGGRAREPAAARARGAARRSRPRRGGRAPARARRARRLGARRLRARAEHAQHDARSADVPARAPPGSPAREEPERRPEAVRLPDARPGGDARPLQGNRGRSRPALPRLPRLVHHALVSPLPAAARAARTRVVVDWTVSLLFRRDLAELGMLGQTEDLGT